MATTKEKIQVSNDGNALTIHRQHDVTDDIHRAEVLRQAQQGCRGESRLSGTIPMFLITEWMKEAGVDPSDNDARQEIMKRKILSGEFDKFRVWKGTW